MKKIILIVVLTLSSSLYGQTTATPESRDFVFAQNLENQGMYDLAAEQYALYVENYPTSLRAPQACFRAGVNLEKSGQIEHAMHTFRSLLLKYPQSGFIDQGQFHLANLLLQQGDAEKAAVTFERIRLFSPQSDLVPQAQVNAAHAFIKAKDLMRASDAIHVVLEDLKTHPIRLKARFVLARIRNLQNQPKLALQELNKLSGTSRSDSLADKALLLKADLLKQLGHFQAADSVLMQLVTSDFASVRGEAAMQHAESLHLNGQFNASNALIQKALNSELLPEHQTTLYLLQCDNDYALNNYEQALASLEKIPNQNAKDQKLNIEFRQAILLKKTGELLAAEKAFQNIVHEQDTSRFYPLVKLHTLFNLADLYVDKNQPQKAIRLLRLHSRDQELSNRVDQLLFQLGRLNMHILGDFDAAIRSFTSLVEVAPQSRLIDNAQYRIAQCLERSERCQQALDAYQRYLNAFPYGDDYLKVQNRLRFLHKFCDSASGSQQDHFSTFLLTFLNGRPTALDFFNLAKEQVKRHNAYRFALLLLKHALQEDQRETIPDAELLYYLAFCHARLAEKAYDQGKQQLAFSHQDTLENTLTLLKKNFSITSWTERAQLLSERINLLNSKSLVDSLAILQQLLSSEVRDEEHENDVNTLLYLYVRASESSVDASPAFPPLESVRHTQPGSWQYLQYYTLITQGHVDSAYQVLSNFIQAYPGHYKIPTAKIIMAKKHVEDEAYEKARSILQSLIAEAFYNHKVSDANSLLCKSYYKAGEIGTAKSCVEKRLFPIESDLGLYLRQPFFEDDFWLLTKIKIETEPFPIAMKTLQHYYFLTENHKPRALYEMGKLAEKNDRLEVAAGHFEELFNAFPEDTLAQIARIKSADLYYDRGDYAKAKEIYVQQLPHLEDETHMNALGRRVLCDYKLGNIQRADQLAESFKKQYDSRLFEAQFLYERGLHHIQMKRFDLAEDDFKTIIKKYEKTPFAGRGKVGLARLYVVLNKTDNAITTLTEITTEYKNPDILADAYLNLGDFYYENRQIQNCIHACNKVLELKEKGPKRKSALHLLINAYDDVRLWDRAIALAREYVRLYPDAKDVTAKRTKIGIFLYSLKEYDRAIAYLKELKPLVDAQTRTEVQYWIAKCYADRGDFDKAKSEFLKVKYVCEPHKLPFGATALYEAGALYKKEGDWQKAKELFTKVVNEMGTNHPIGRSASQKIAEIEAQSNS